MDSLLQELGRAYDANPNDIDAAGIYIAALRRVAAGQEVYRYQRRNLPANILPDERLWCVVGGFTDTHGSGGGILEWCYDRQDAEDRMEMMGQDPRYSSLKAEKYWPDCSWCDRAVPINKGIPGSCNTRYCNDFCQGEHEEYMAAGE